MAKCLDSLDIAFRALADPTRRSVVARLAAGPASVGELAGDFAMALPSFVKHVRQLEAAGLVATRKSGRVRICTLERQPFRVVESWIDEQQRLWEERADRLEELVTTEEDSEDRP
ncbi:ArsR/SmtB family transcription factor [Arthrobacter sp.]|uniref:ArsR/SmtB family transcription factor n=1 Tax=Arthrobacter sp. TaxID=1667 RepID=UPI003A8D4B3C